MSKLTVFNFITLDGYYKDQNNGIAWHQHGEEEAGFSADNLKTGNRLLFGRVTYEMMAGFWSSPMAFDSFPEVAEGMNKAEKIVFSNTLKKADWQNTRVVNGDIVAEIKKIKQAPGNDMTILGSGSIVTQFASAGIIDQYQVMIDPIAIGRGTTIFKNIAQQLDLTLSSSRAFKSGAMLLNYTAS